MTLRLLLLLTLVMSLAACNGIGGGDRRGSGNVITEEREVSGFNQVLVSGSGIAEIIQGESESLSVEAEDNIMPLIEARVDDGVLILDQKSDSIISVTKPIRYTITMVDVTGLEVSGSGAINADQIDTSIISFGISGSGDINIDALDGDSVDATVSGSGKVTVAGDIADQVVEISGSGEYRAGNLRSATTVVNVSGSGNATVWVDNTLDVTVSGSGDVSYYGDPILSQSITGSGDLKSLGTK